MKIRRFYGSNIRSALRKVTEEFGTDAAILSNKKVAGGVEIIAALEYDDSLIPSTKVDKGSREGISNDTDIVKTSLDSESAIQKAVTANLDDSANHSNKERFATSQGTQDSQQQSSGISEFGELLSQSSSATGGLMPDLKNTTDESEFCSTGMRSSGASSSSHSGSLEWSLDPSLQAMKEELGLMRSMMSEQLKGIGWNRFAEQDPQSAMIMRRLSSLGIDREILNLMLPQIEGQTDAECAWQNVLAVLAKSLPICTNELLDNGGIYALMGPTGVGKTTSIAKLAARFVIKHGNDTVALITTDNYRISAQEQITTFGRILGVSTARVTKAQPLDYLLKKLSNKRLILIDTAGISSADHHLTQALDAIEKSRHPVRKMLLMSASSQGAVLNQSLKLFTRYQPDNIVITKLDEAANLGEVLSVVMKAQIPIAYTTDGQRVPEDLRVARSHHLISKAVWLANKFERSTDDWALAQSIIQVKSA